MTTAGDEYARPVPLTEGQRRHLEIMLSGLAREARVWRDSWRQTAGSGSAVAASLHELTQAAEQAARTLGVRIDQRAPPPERRLASWATAWWSTVLDSRPRALRGYGEVDSRTAEVVEPLIEDLSARLTRIRRLLETEPEPGDDRSP